MKLNLKTRKEYLTLAKELIDKAKVPFKVKKDRKALELKIAEVEAEVAEREDRIHELVSDKDGINWNSVKEAIDRKELKARELKMFNELLEQLFKNSKSTEKEEVKVEEAIV